jgi:O-antigen/teichoic acid export membrane protein
VIQIRRTINNLVNVVGGEVLLRAVNALVAVLIGRVYGVAVLGTYAAILAVATVAERIADNGLELTGITEVSRRPDRLNTLATALYIDKSVLSVVAMGFLALSVAIMHFSGEFLSIAALLTVRTFAYSFCRLNAGLLKALDKTRPIALIQAMHFAVLSTCVFVVYSRHTRFAVLLVCLLVAQIMEFASTFTVLRRLGLRGSCTSPSLCWQLVRHSTPVGMTYTLSTLMLRGDIVVLSFVASASVVGVFAAANTGLIMIYVIAWLFSGILLSDLGTLAANRESCDAHFREILSCIILFTLPLAAVSAVFARSVILLVFGKSFAGAALPGALMMLALPFIFINAAFLSRTIARNASRVSLGIYGFTAVLSLALNYLLARWQGANGVACSIVVREAVMTVLFVRLWNLPEAAKPPAFETNPEFATLLNT